MDMFTKPDSKDFMEPLCIEIPCNITNNTQAYTCLCVNEILKTLGIIKEEEYNIVYAMIADSEIFTEF